MAQPQDQLDRVPASVPIVVAGQNPDEILAVLRAAAKFYLGDSNRFLDGAGLMKRKLITKGGAASLTADEVKFAMVKTSTAATMTLPAAAAALEGADVIIASADAHTTTVVIAAAASFGNGGATETDIALTVGIAGHFYCDGVFWYYVGNGTLS